MRGDDDAQEVVEEPRADLESTAGAAYSSRSARVRGWGVRPATAARRPGMAVTAQELRASVRRAPVVADVIRSEPENRDVETTTPAQE
jgi:hypothetical protein